MEGGLVPKRLELLGRPSPDSRPEDLERATILQIPRQPGRRSMAFRIPVVGKGAVARSRAEDRQEWTAPVCGELAKIAQNPSSPDLAARAGIPRAYARTRKKSGPPIGSAPPGMKSATWAVRSRIVSFASNHPGRRAFERTE